MITPYFNEDKFSSRSKKPCRLKIFLVVRQRPLYFSFWKIFGSTTYHTRRFNYFMSRRNVALWSCAVMLVKNLYMSKASYLFPIWPHFISVLVLVVEFTQFTFFIIGVLYIILSGILGLGGIYRFIFGLERLEETILVTPFAFSWRIKTRYQ